MNISQTLLQEHSKKMTFRISSYIRKNPAQITRLIDLVRSDNIVISQRASWVLGMHCEKTPDLLKAHLGKLLPLLDKPVHDAVKRNILRVLQKMNIPVKFESSIVDHCFDF